MVSLFKVLIINSHFVVNSYHFFCLKLALLAAKEIITEIGLKRVGAKKFIGCPLS